MIYYEFLKCGLNSGIYLILKEKERISFFSALGRVLAHRPHLNKPAGRAAAGAGARRLPASQPPE
jgi:hypothetical protein